MFPWGRLPTDIRLLILKAFCIDIACTYEDAFNDSKYVLKRIIAEMKDGRGFHVPEDFVYPSATLSSFVSAIQTCREFNDIILNKLVINTDSPRNNLCSLQAEFLRRIQSYEIFVAQHPEIQDINNLVCGSAEFYMRCLGNIWQNPLLIERPGVLPCILTRASREISSAYIPRLGPWLAHHSVENPGYPALTLNAFSYSNNDYKQWDMAQKEYQDTVFYAFDTRFQPSWNMSPRIGLKRVNIFGTVVGTIVGISPSTSHSETGELSLLEADIKSSHMDEWWYIPQLCNTYGIGGRAMEFGTLVNYKEGRLYHLQNPRRCLAWEHPCDEPERWKSLRSLEEIAEHRS